MKNVILLGAFLASMPCFAGNIAEVSTSNVVGVGENGVKASECIYQASINTYEHSGLKELKISLRSDGASLIAFDFELPATTVLPLKDGFFYLISGKELVTYKNGILKYVEQEEDDDNRFIVYNETIEITVSPDLKQVSGANAIVYTRKPLTETKYVKSEMKCAF